jgi:hypothetical protein
VLTELRNANSGILDNQNGIECLKDSEGFKKHYATVLVELKEASGQACGFLRLFMSLQHFALALKQLLIGYIFQVSDTMLQLRQRNTYTDNSLPPWMKPRANFEVHDELPSVLDSSMSQESRSNVIEIIKGSRLRAHAMLDAAFQVYGLGILCPLCFYSHYEQYINGRFTTCFLPILGNLSIFPVLLSYQIIVIVHDLVFHYKH